MNNNSGNGNGGGGFFAVLGVIAAIILAIILLPSLIKWLIIFGLIFIGAIIVLIVVLANKAGNSKSSAGQKKSGVIDGQYRDITGSPESGSYGYGNAGSAKPGSLEYGSGKAGTGGTAETDGTDIGRLKSARALLVDTRMACSKIADGSISRSGVAVCASIEKTLQTLKEKPELIDKSGQLFNYYLPTFNRVIMKYQRFESTGLAADDMPEKVAAYIGNVQEAMDNMYVGLFEKDRLRMDVDMEAMTLTLKRDGLLEDDDFEEIRAAALAGKSEE